MTNEICTIPTLSGVPRTSAVVWEVTPERDVEP